MAHSKMSHFHFKLVIIMLLLCVTSVSSAMQEEGYLVIKQQMQGLAHS